MNYYERIQTVINNMEQQLETDIRVETIAREAYLSVPSLYRLFFAITGYQVKEYLIRRRISMAAADLELGRGRVIDIAGRYCYQSPDAFSRTFKRLTGSTPSSYGQAANKFYFERIDIMAQYFEHPDRDMLENYPDIKIVRHLPAMRVACCCCYGRDPETHAFLLMKQWFHKNHLDIKNSSFRIFGYNAPDSDPSADEYGYEVCVTIPEDMDINDEQIKPKILPGGTYAICSVERQQDLGEEIMKAWQRFETWLKGSRYVYGQAQWLEEHLDFTTDFNHVGGVDLYMPVILKSEFISGEQEVFVDPFPIISCTVRGRGAERKARACLFQWLDRHAVKFSAGTRLFATYNFERIGTPEFAYKICVEVPEELAVDDPKLVKETWNGGLYLTRTIRYKTNGPSWYSFMDSIKSSSKYKFGKQPFMERYLIEHPEINAETEVLQYMPVSHQ